MPPPKALSYAADAGPFEDGGVTSFHLGGRYGSYSAEKAAYWKHGYGVPINPRYRPGQNGRNWFVGAMEVADHGFSGLAFAGSSRAAPFDEIHVNFLADAEECYYSAANASTALAAHDSYRCKLMITACVEWSASNTGWCDKSKFALGRDAPAYPTLTTDDARELKSQIEAYLACADEAVDATTPAGGRLTSCPVPLTADYMLDALFAFGVIRGRGRLPSGGVRRLRQPTRRQRILARGAAQLHVRVAQDRRREPAPQETVLERGGRRRRWVRRRLPVHRHLYPRLRLQETNLGRDEEHPGGVPTVLQE